MEQVDTFDLGSLEISARRREDLLSLFPEVRTEAGRIDFDQLKRVLGQTVDPGRERYGLTWPGKAECFKTIQAPSIATLRPVPEDSVNFSTAENLIIEGDNLEVLKLLQKSYLGKIKMIYIDPPYNTGNDFIYPDNYAESLQTYLAYTGQADSEGRKFGTNTEADGRFHSKWLNMMYPRLYLARNLLTDDGVLITSISDVEFVNCKKLIDEIFGEDNYLGTLIWKSRQIVDSRNKSNISADHEYLLVVARDADRAQFRGRDSDPSKYSNPDSDRRGPWMSNSILGLANAVQRPNLHYQITDPRTGRIFDCPADSGWRYSKETMQKKISEGRIIFPKNHDGRPREKKYLSELASTTTGFSTLLGEEAGYTLHGTREVRDILGGKYLDFPKPTTLLKVLIEQLVPQQGIVLDFFAGSGTTAQAVLEQNEADGGRRRFILVQLPEPTGSDNEYRTIAEIARQRVRRVLANLGKKESGELALRNGNKQDLGFRAFVLSDSNFANWEADASSDTKHLSKQLSLHISHVHEARTDLDLVYEILMKDGYPLAATVEDFVLAGKPVFSVADGALLVCVDRALTIDLIRAIAARNPERVVCLDEGFAGNDQLKSNAVQTFKTRNIVFRTI